jgi:long-chain acyl-CoA synthetase
VRPYDLPLALRFRDVLAAGRSAQRVPEAVALDDVAFLQYTGGTTGVAKGATLTHRNVAANVAQIEAWLRPSLGERPTMSWSRHCRSTTSSP